MLKSDLEQELRTRLVFGPGSISRLGELAASITSGAVLLVTDAGLRAAGHAQRAFEALRAAGLEVSIFDEVIPNPTTREIERGTEFARSRGIQLIVGFGGGSSLDCAKGINFLLTNGGRMQDYQGMGKASRPMLPFIAVPTTAGTGSEAQSYAVVADEVTHVKMACGDRKALARIVLLDPALTLTMPRHVAAATGVDAISHAVESYVTTRRNALSQIDSRQAWKLLSRAFLKVMRNGEELSSRVDMLLGAHRAGAAIENSMLGATHALANPLTARFDLPHGVAIGILLPHVVRFNAHIPKTARLYSQLACDADLCGEDDPQAPELLAQRLEQYVAAADQPRSLNECGVPKERLPQLAEEAAVQWTGKFNPRPVDPPSLLEIYRCATV